MHEGLAAYQKDNQNILERWTSGIYACGLQIGEPAIVSAITNIITVNNYRPADHVLGGTGAPLMQYLDYIAFREIGPVLTLNIGGIANCHLAHKDRSKMYAFDTGPGNVMIDHAMNILYGLDYDKDGETARSGKIISAMLDELFQHEYFKRPIPRCAWRLDFGSS
ncbi:anhydro-N-acetylmuramic acid kinase, partial [Klebsiella pneumoniae]|uniref:anhydro-N-acetylmuramic acid kinase n=1 Tax=Klebsiella pneumoniae TaxID=573 RepID=UPI000B13FE99